MTPHQRYQRSRRDADLRLVARYPETEPDLDLAKRYLYQRLPADQWGEAWIRLMSACLRYRPKRGPFLPWAIRCMRDSRHAERRGSNGLVYIGEYRQ